MKARTSKEPANTVLPQELTERAEELVDRYPVSRSALLPLLHLVQVEQGYVSREGIGFCAALLGLTKAEVAAVATFYTMYKREPLGEHLVSVCTNFSCKVRGGLEVYERISAKLGVGHEETTEDGKITLEHAECLGNCEGAPVVTVDYLNYECVSPERAEELCDEIRAGDLPLPTRGITPSGVREIQHRLAGLGPRDPSEPGAPTDQARASDGGLPVPEAGPGAPLLPIQPSLSPADEAEREEARRRVREAGHDEQAVEAAAGPRAREFPTRSQEAEEAPGGGTGQEHDAEEPGEEEAEDG